MQLVDGFEAICSELGREIASRKGVQFVTSIKYKTLEKNLIQNIIELKGVLDPQDKYLGPIR